MYKCLNDLVSGYCDGTPDFGDDAVVMGKDKNGKAYEKFRIKTCKLGPKTCGRCLSHKQLCEREGFTGVTLRKGIRTYKRPGLLKKKANDVQEV